MAIPIYLDQGHTYAADTCEPVAQAAASGRIHHAALVSGHYPGRPLPKNTLPGIKTVGLWDAPTAQDWALDWHRNEGLELTFLETGALGFSVEGHDCSLKSGDLTITRPWQRHRVGNPHIGPSRLHFLILDVSVRRPHQPWRWPAWIVLTPDDLRHLTDMLRQNEQPVWHASPEVAASFRRISAAVETDSNGSQASALTVHINHLLLLLLEMLRRETVPLDASLTDSLRTVDLYWADLRQHPEHLAQEWTVAAMARQCGLGTTHFTHHSKQLTNMTPMQYLNHCRLNAAAELLKNQPTRSITDVALTCGFTSSQYFATAFRRQFNASPRTWQNREGKQTANPREFTRIETDGER